MASYDYYKFRDLTLLLEYLLLSIALQVRKVVVDTVTTIENMLKMQFFAEFMFEIQLMLRLSSVSGTLGAFQIPKLLP